MNVFIKRYRIEILVVLAIAAVYFFLRLYRLMSLPIFTDEAIYTRWSQIAMRDPNWRFISLTDGKQPSFVWLDMIVMRFVHDPLLAGRLLSVGVGFLTMVGMFFLSRELFRNRWIAIVSAGLYAVFPFAIVYERMALYEPLVNLFVVWSFYLAVVLVRLLRSDTTYQLGLTIGVGLLTKSNLFVTIVMLPTTLLIFDWRKKNRVLRFRQWVVSALIASVLAYACYSILRLSPFFHIIGEKNLTFVYSVGELLNFMHPQTILSGNWKGVSDWFNFIFLSNLRGLWDWFVTYMSWPWVILITGAFIFFKEFWREKILLLVWFVAPFMYAAIFGKVLYPRYILFMVVYLIPILAYGFVKLYGLIENKMLLSLIVLALLVFPLRADYFIDTAFAYAPIPKADLDQFINSWPAGNGVNQINTYLSAQAQTQQIYVASDGTFGSVPTLGVEIYLGDNSNIQKRGIWPIPNKIPSDLVQKAMTMPVYFIQYHTPIPPAGWPLKMIARYRQGIGNDYMTLYQVEAR